MKDKLGLRMKSQYEHRTRMFLPRRTYTLIRLDGKAFHTFTKGFKRPYDLELMHMMDNTAKALCEQIQGVKFAYVQSDEITLLLTDFEKIHTDAYFDGNIQKITSISAAIATAEFNRLNITHHYDFGKLYELDKDTEEYKDMKSDLDEKVQNNTYALRAECMRLALFDSRVFTIPDRTEVENCFVWRQQDATKNSISMVGQAHFSHKELHQKNSSQVQDMLMLEKDVNWNDCPAGFKRGRVVVKETFMKGDSERTRWVIKPAEIFTGDDRSFFKEQIPVIGGE